MQISYVITAYNKEAYIEPLVKSLCMEIPDSAAIKNLDREYIFVDDGSKDDTISAIHSYAPRLPGPYKIIEQHNQGAAAATNAGVAEASYEWIRLVDGDDVVCSLSTPILYDFAEREALEFVMGSYSYFENEDAYLNHPTKIADEQYIHLSQEDAISRFIKNFPYNSSCMLIKKSLFEKAGGSDVRLVSPDYSLCLRAVAAADAIGILDHDVCMMPLVAPNRLSSQQNRSRYESILALFFLAHEIFPDRHDIGKRVYQRACSRASRYAKEFNNHPLYHKFRYLLSKIFTPQNLRQETLKCLGAFTHDKSISRPQDWKPNAVKSEPDMFLEPLK